MNTIQTAANLDELLAAVKQAPADTDLSDLPTFGGADPDDTDGVYSWDVDRLLVGDSQSALEIVYRLRTEGIYGQFGARELAGDWLSVEPRDVDRIGLLGDLVRYADDIDEDFIAWRATDPDVAALRGQFDAGRTVLQYQGDAWFVVERR